MFGHICNDIITSKQNTRKYVLKSRNLIYMLLYKICILMQNKNTRSSNKTILSNFEVLSTILLKSLKYPYINMYFYLLFCPLLIRKLEYIKYLSLIKHVSKFISLAIYLP